MKKPLIIFSVFVILVSVMVYSCSTKNDPPVPNHNANISTSGNSIQFVKSGATFTFNFGNKKCSIDTSMGRHYSMYAKDLNSGFNIDAIFFDSVAPTTSPTYTIMNVLTTPSLSPGQCFVFLTAPTISSSQYIATGGSLNYNPGSGNPSTTVTNVPMMNVSDSSTATITGNWTCQ